MPPITRELMHTRQITCQGYARSDGLYDIEARLQDITPLDTDMLFKQLRGGESIHDMRIVMTIGADLVIHDIEARMEATPTVHCPEIAPSYAALKGLSIGPGFKRKARELVGDVKGCTHVTELLGSLATTAMQTIFSVRRKAGLHWRALEGTGPLPKPALIGTCHAYRPDGETVKVMWPLHRRA